MNLFKGKLHWIKNLYGRYRYGAGCCDLFNAEYFLAKKILPVLKAFREKNNFSFPSHLESMEKWHEILDEMIFAFQWLLDGEEYEDYEKEGKAMYDRQQKGFELFGEHFRGLWM